MNQNVVPIRGPGRPAFDKADKHTADRFSRACRAIKISKHKPQSLWRQLAEQLETVIRDGSLEPQSRIPSEEALAEMFGVSRPVVRNALQALASRGLIVKVHRKGVFVGSPPLETDFMASDLSVFDHMVTHGHRVRTETFEFFRTTPDEREREALRLDNDTTVVRIGRVFWIDDQPIIYSFMSLSGEKVPGLETIDIRDRSLFGLVQERYGLKLRRADRWFRATHAPVDVAKAMNVTTKTPLMWIESIAYLADNSPLEYSKSYYNSHAGPQLRLSVVD